LCSNDRNYLDGDRYQDALRAGEFTQKTLHLFYQTQTFALHKGGLDRLPEMQSRMVEYVIDDPNKASTDTAFSLIALVDLSNGLYILQQLNTTRNQSMASFYHDNKDGYFR